jgi:hypothetical protein
MELPKSSTSLFMMFCDQHDTWSVKKVEVSMAAHPQAMDKVLRIVYRTLTTHLIHKAGYSLMDGATGAVTLIQRFGSTLNVNIYFHILFLDGVCVCRDDRPPRFGRVKAPYNGELEDLV